MKRALTLLFLCAACGGPTAVMVTIAAQPGDNLRVPDDIDHLSIDIKDGATLVGHGDFALQAPQQLPVTVSIIEGKARNTVLVEVEAKSGGRSGNHVAAGAATASFKQKGTVNVSITLTK